MKRFAFVFPAILVLVLGGCRTGEFRFDHEIYSAMPALLGADEGIVANTAQNEDGTLSVTFEKGEMYVRLAHGTNAARRMVTISDALLIFHDQYISHPDVKRNDGGYRRESIRIRGFIDETELYVIRWDLGEDMPDVESNRDSNYF